MSIVDNLDYSSDLLEKFEVHSYNQALEILLHAFPEEWNELAECLRKLEITTDDLRKAGGNESQIPKIFNDILYPLGWRATQISSDLHVRTYIQKGKTARSQFSDKPNDNKELKGYIGGHIIDFVKNRVAFDLEWNSKDQTFDRDLLAMRTYYDCGIVSVGVIVTRSKELNDVFRTVFDYDSRAGKWKPILRKYGASTTWMGKLTDRLESRRNGGCPILAVGIKKNCISDWEEGYIDEHNPNNR